MFKIQNIPRQIFLENFWKTVEEEITSKKNENNFYAFYKRGEVTYINASNEYDMLLKFHKNTKTFIDDMCIYEEIISWNIEKNFETERELYKYYVDEILSALRVQDYRYEQLVVIQ